MDVRLYWSGDLPEYLGPLLEALEALPETDVTPDGEVVFCPDATSFAPPADPGDAYVAAVPNPEGLFNAGASDALVDSLRPWVDRDALFMTPTRTAVATLRAALDLPAERVRVVPMPLPPARVPAEAGGGADILAIPPINYNALLPAVGLTRLAGIESRVVFAEYAAEPLVRPGGLANAHGLLASREAVVVDDWREAVRSAGAIVMFDAHADDGSLLRELLATGVPLVTPQTATLDDHLGAVGAGVYPYAGPNNVASLAMTIVAALRRDRGTKLERAARAAVLAESWARAAAAVYGVLMEALAPAPLPEASVPIALSANGSTPVDARVSDERLSICVLNARASGGGGERFMRELVGAMAKHESRPHIKLVCNVKPKAAFDPGTRALQSLGVDVRLVPGTDFDAVARAEMKNADVVYSSWPHMSDPPLTGVPLVCTFHDLNWKHFDVYEPPDKAQLEVQTPRWIERSAAMVHSSNFIRDEMRGHYGAPDSLLHVIPLTAGTPSEPASQAEREAVRRRFALPERFLLSPAGAHLHKNYPVLDVALRKLRREGRPLQVVATGEGTDYRYHGPDLIGLGYVNARELQALYEESAGIVQTTLYEAGSWPMWEANIAGKPAAISRIPSVVEQVERLGTVVELFDPLDPDELAAALTRLWEGSPATDPRTLAANAAAVASRSWDDVASDYLDLFANLRRASRV